MDRTKPQRVVVMTGVTAGLSAHALRHIAAQPDTRVIVDARGNGRKIPRGVEVIPLDLASLASVRQFINTVRDQLGEAGIDVLVLNAGMQSSTSEGRSSDDYELTFAVNHLAHYLLARLLLPDMADHGRLIITTSETHDPAVTPIAPKTLEPQVLARPGKSGFGSGIRAYAASKLCNLLTAQSFAALDDVKARGITVVAFSPGLTGGTSLGRDSPRVARALVMFLMHTVFRLVGLFRPEYVVGTPERAGEALAEVSLGAVTLPAGRIYLSLVKGKPTFPDPSALAQSPDARERLWRESAVMVGLGQMAGDIGEPDAGEHYRDRGNEAAVP
ncbi:MULTISPECIES: SDR family NAD(P)-dependent oxidoreductase [unclassified Rhizobium]|uniref:SDR family NAD(P)-dependent oxidoreductase n=1 Tax=unclassified Rhizobium TaxID=2613769 RepID=UPI0007EA45F6|nr:MULTISPECIES: SDR family NAD(P)-dependent oxidoreductase [unclassified Rhizobium]ANL12135.1 short-chain dehydrogenase/reductase SDR family protein [Rhizobium sp. N1341]ANM42980.1 short-chain dehydrogenase/reductase SDR family protein [Rhizobium sp. N741]